MKQLIADLGSKATNSALGLVKGGNDINILDNGELQLDTEYDSVDVNASANIANITKGGKFKTILGNIVAALTGVNSSVTQLNSDFAKINIPNTPAAYNGDLNNLEVFACVYTNTAANVPSPAWGFIFTYSYNSTVAMQLAVSVDNHMYIRTKNASSTWSGWTTIK